MKKIQFIIAAACVILFTACHDKGEWDAPDGNAPSEYGNNNIQETNVVSIKKLLEDYKQIIADGSMTEITTDLQIKGFVTCNDVGGNFYKKITIQDAPATASDARALTISIDESGIWGYLPIGQEVLIDLKGLHIGGYGKMANVGIPYTNNKGAVSVGRMPPYTWHKHFKIIKGSMKQIEPVEFDATVKGDMDNYAAMLVKFTNVTFKGADGEATLKSGPEAALAGYYQTWLSDDAKYGTNVVFFTSGDYAKFSSYVLPYDKDAGKAIPGNIVGIASRYNSTWQISIRKSDDLSFPSKYPSIQ